MADDAGAGVDRPRRLDAFVRHACPTLSRRLVHRLIDEGAVRVNGRAVPKGFRVTPGDHVTLPRLALVPEPDLPVPVVHVDAELVVVDKPGGMRGHALDPRQRGTVAGFLAGRFPETATIGDPLSSGLVHRLDTGTSGLLLAARTAEAYSRMRAAFRAGRVTKRYLAAVAGMPPRHVVVETALSHDPGDRRRMTAATGGLRAWPARTEVTTVRAGGGRALVEAAMHSGVTHQVRVHLALLGCPVLGDALYGGPDVGLPSGRHALHASALVLEGDAGTWHSALPPDLASLTPD